MVSFTGERREMMKKFSGLFFISCLVVSVWAGASYAYDEIDVADGGSIMGHVIWKGGAVPKNDPLKVQKNQDVCGNEKPSESLIVGKEGGVKFAVGYIEKIDKGKKIVRGQNTLLNQKNCVFGPHVFTMVKGTDLDVLNSDPVLHNINTAISGIQLFNKGQPNKDTSVTIRVRKLGHVDVTCDSHTHMQSYFSIFDHPYHTTSDDNGVFTIDNVPPGKYTVKVWHESWKVKGKDDDGRLIYDKPVELSQEVTVSAKGTAHVNFELK
jgi:plastocyanin